MKKTFILFVVLSVTILTGCAISNEGSTDFRYIKPNIPTESGKLLPGEKYKYIKPRDFQNEAIQPKDALIISLKQAFIKKFTEIRSPIRFIRVEPANGELAIVVNAFEIGKGSALDFGPSGKKNARVVFYSDDVWEGQFLNFSNLSTIYGPITYDGGPFILDLYMIEMDTPGEQLRQLLANLAAIGATFYPPAAPIAGPIAQLAGTLITDDQDDRAYHYTAEFKPLNGGYSNLNSGVLLKGDYVFIREENRHDTTNWNELDYDERTGRLVYSNCKKPDDNSDYKAECFFKEKSYVVVEINTAESALQNDVAQMTYEQLSSSVFGNSASILRTQTPEDTLTNISSGISVLRYVDDLNRQLKILNNDESDPTKKGIALNRFLRNWKNSTIVLNPRDQEHIENLLAKKMLKCPQNDHSKVTGIINKFRDRENFNPSDPEIISALTCS